MSRMSSSLSYRSFISLPPARVDGDYDLSAPFIAADDPENVSLRYRALRNEPAPWLMLQPLWIQQHVLHLARRDTEAVPLEDLELLQSMSREPDLGHPTSQPAGTG